MFELFHLARELVDAFEQVGRELGVLAGRLLIPVCGVEQAVEGDGKVEAWLVVVGFVEEAMAIFTFHNDLFDGRIVYTEGHALHVVVVVGHLFVTGCIGVVVFETAEDIERLLAAQALYLRENVVARFYADAIGVACYRRMF